MSQRTAAGAATVGRRLLAVAPRSLPVPRVSAGQIAAALRRAELHRRARAGDVLAVAAVTGIDPADLYAEALALAAMEGTA